MSSNELTVQEKTLMDNITKEYLELICMPINKPEAEKGVDFLYSLAGFSAPKKVFVESPLSAQYIYNMISVCIDNDAKVRKFKTVVTSEKDEVWDKTLAIFLETFADDLNGYADRAENYLKENCYKNRDMIVSTSWNGNISDAGYVAYYQFYIENGTTETTENFEKMKAYLKSGIYDCIQLQDICIVISHPNDVKTDSEGRLHSEEGFAIKFNDSHSLCFWHGLQVPSKLIFFKELINKEDLNAVENVEIKRAFQEVLGEKRFFELLDVELINESTDRSNRPLKLYKSKEVDPLAEEFIYFLQIVDHSTEREYVICVEGSSGDARTELARSYAFKTWEEYAPESES